MALEDDALNEFWSVTSRLSLPSLDVSTLTLPSLHNVFKVFFGLEVRASLILGKRDLI